MTLRYYAQAGEDALLWSVFAGERPGFFIDVGAFDGRYLSNSMSFEEQGWKGICVEAHPEYFLHCQANRTASTCIHAACVGPDDPPTARFLTEPLGILSGIRADETLDLAARYAKRGMIFPGFTEVEVPALTLDSIIAEYHPDVSQIDFLSVDVEGTEIDVIRGLSVEARVIVVEANTQEASRLLHEYMADRKYVAARSIAQNFFFTRDRRVAGILASATFDITTEGVLHPLGEAATYANHAGKRICL
jgi:FkbM family methyltransferase